jgi:hypothetical protein
VSDGRLRRALAIGLAAGRLAIGASLWLAPGLGARLLGFGELDSRAVTLARLAATRDLVIGGWQLAALSDPAQLRAASAAAAITDAGDALAFALALRSSDPGTRRAGMRGVAAAAPAALAGVGVAAAADAASKQRSPDARTA